MNDNNIKCIGRLVDNAVMVDVEKYFGSKVISTVAPTSEDSEIESNFIM